MSQRHIDFPFHFNRSGRTADTTWPDHCRDMLLQFLLTYPGERVNRPDFGTPLSRMCFEGNSPGLADVIQFVAQAGLQRWLSDGIEVVSLTATAEEATLLVDLKYRVKHELTVRQETRRIPLVAGALS